MESLTCRVVPAHVRRRVHASRTSTVSRASPRPCVCSSPQFTNSGRRHVVATLLGTALLLARPATAEEGAEESVAPAAADGQPKGLPPPEDCPPGFQRYYGRATSVSSYAGYGGADENYRYSFVLPQGWKSGTVSKTMKSTNGTDCIFTNPGKKGQSVYVVSFLGASYERLKEDRTSIINDLALSDSAIQDALSFADKVEVTNKTKNGQAYADFDIIGGGEAIYVSVTSDGSRLFALFVTGAGPGPDDQARIMRDSLVTLDLKA